MKKLTLIKSVAAAVAVIGSGVAMAAVDPLQSFEPNPQTANMAVSATVVHLCRTATASNLAFGNYAADETATASSSISVKCTNTSPVTISLNGGSNSGSAAGARVMKSGQNSLSYTLHKTDARTTNWGEGTDAVTTAGVGLDTNISGLTVYGKIVPQPGTIPGDYTDTVLVTVAY